MNMTQEKTKRWMGFELAVVAVLAVVMALPGCARGTRGTGLAKLYQLQNYQAKRESSSHPDLHSNGDARPIGKGQTLVLGDLEGPGIITHIWCTVGSFDPFYGRSLVLRIYWDGADKPSVEVPLGDFFGVGHGAYADFESIPVNVSSHGRARNCFWPMPFRKRAKVTVTTESTKYDTDSFYYYLDWQKHEKLANDISYFHARYRQAMPAGPGDYTILETTGRGHYVGTVYSVQQVELGWFGEGDDRFYIDGEKLPSLRGTGTEDYFGDAWGFRQFSRPYYGVSLWEGYFPGDRVTAYRWHLQDPISFRKSLKVAIEHRGSVFTDTGQNLGQFYERPDWVSSAAFWYQSPPVGFNEPIAPVDKRIAPYRVLRFDELEVSATPESGLGKEKTGFLYLPGTADAQIEFDFEVAQEGRYQMSAFLTHSVFGSRYQPFLDGKRMGRELDLCISGHDQLWVSLDLHDLNKGKHTLRFEGRGPSSRRRSAAPAHYAFGITYLFLLRLDDMQGYHQLLRERTGR